MTLAADALAHVALPGIGIALALHIHPLLGATAALFFGALLVWALEDRGRIATETLVGVVFSAALAIGAMITSGHDLVEALFGDPGALGGGGVRLAATAVSCPSSCATEKPGRRACRGHRAQLELT
jgi:ABC-type Mn2+/Zn2+ transport system permease subunit